MYLILSISIIIFNTLFYVFTPPAVESIGLNLKTDETRMICNGITYCLLVDMIVLPVMIGTNLSEYTTFGEKDIVEDVLNTLGIMWGRNTDFGARWYPDTGQIIMMTMIIFSIQALIDFLVDWLLVSLGRCYTRRWVYSSKKSKNETEAEAMSRYMGLHAGPRYLFYSQCANTNCLVVVCLTLGPLMPWMYWMCFYGLIVQYVVDRMTLTYFYRTPP